MKAFLILLCACVCLPARIAAAQEKALAHWAFDSVVDQKTPESITNSSMSVIGNSKLVDGVRGKALQLDESSSAGSMDSAGRINLQGSFAIEVWIAARTYPYNWCPIIEQRDENTGFFFGIDYQGRLGFTIWTDEGRFDCFSRPALPGLDESVSFAGEAAGRKIAHFAQDTYPDPVIPLLRWTHLAATYNADDHTMSIYVNGARQGLTNAPGRFRQAADKPFAMFRAAEARVLPFLARPKANDPVHAAVDGLVDELQIIGGVQSVTDIKKRFDVRKPANIQPLSYRRMPTGQDKPGSFGAFYTHLAYDADWDRTRRMGPDQDILVRFTDNPCTFVCWNGTIYPVMYNETGNAGQQFEAFETWDKDGCHEAMMDKLNRYSSWRIIENNDARIVLHWRHSLVSFNNNFINLDAQSGWSDWVDDYYYIYPDFVIARKTTLWSSKPKSNHSYAQDNSVLQPGLMPWDIYEREPITIANLRGQQSHMGMGKDRKGQTDPDFELPAQIEVHNFKSTYKPFMIAPPNEKLKGVWTNDEPWPWFLPCWHHWPVSQIRSDGAITFVNNGRPTSSSLTNGWGGSDFTPDAIRLTPTSLTRFSMIGMTKKSAAELAPLAKSWRQAPASQLLTAGYSDGKYQFEERAYHIRTDETRPDALKIQIIADSDHPTAGVALVLHNIDCSRLSVKVDNAELAPGKGFTWGREKKLEENCLVVWINHSSVAKGAIELTFE